MCNSGGMSGDKSPGVSALAGGRVGVMDSAGVGAFGDGVLGVGRKSDGI